MKDIAQWEQVRETLRKNGGYATLGFLYRNVDVKKWATKTPFESIRRIVQTKDEFFKIKPGLWGLTERKEEIKSIFGLTQKNTPKFELYNHSYYQGLIVEIGNLKGFTTYVPNQDKNKNYLNQQLKSITTLQDIYQFTYVEIINRAKTVDSIWFNKRKLPHAFFEVEHSTDIYNSLIKFSELQDFNSSFNIVSDKVREREFNSKINAHIFSEIKSRVRFINYDQIAELHSHAFRYYNSAGGLSL
jgi:hypothetical protein